MTLVTVHSFGMTEREMTSTDTCTFLECHCEPIYFSFLSRLIHIQKIYLLICIDSHSCFGMCVNSTEEQKKKKKGQQF